MQASDTGEVNLPVNLGSTIQVLLTAANINIPLSLGAMQVAVSNLIPTAGYKVIAVGFQSTGNGTLAIQRYLDVGGTVPQVGDSSLIETFTPNTPVVLNVNDNKAFGSVQLTITNSDNNTNTLSNFLMILQAN